MKKTILLFSMVFLALYSCSSDNDLEIKRVNLSLNFTHNWGDSINITNTDFSTIKFVNQNNDSLSIERLRYLISDVILINQNGDTITSNDYNLVDLTNNENLIFTLSNKIPVGTYKSVKFTFGFDEEDNVDGAYTDLNSASFNVPSMLGGGYHFMQFDGKYKTDTNTEASFNYHMISAIDRTDPNNLIKTNTSFEVNLGEITIGNDLSLTIKVDVSEWFKNPNTWNLKELNTVLMPNYDAQLLMNENGKTVFSLAK